MSDMTRNESVVEWGPEIAVDGKRPDFVQSDDQVMDIDRGRDTDGTVRFAGEWGWSLVHTIRLPADHPHYHPAPAPVPAVDWNKPIEAVHEDGRVIAVKVDRFDDDQVRTEPAAWGENWYHFNGKHLYGGKSHIRNVAEPTPADLAERMEALVRRLARDEAADWPAEARAIVAEMTPVDADLVEARKMVFQENPLSGQVMTGAWDNLPAVHYAFSGIKRGRELERGEK